PGLSRWSIVPATSFVAGWVSASQAFASRRRAVESLPPEIAAAIARRPFRSILKKGRRSSGWVWRSVSLPMVMATGNPEYAALCAPDFGGASEIRNPRATKAGFDVRLSPNGQFSKQRLKGAAEWRRGVFHLRR